jgi:hypothetical protein
MDDTAKVIVKRVTMPIKELNDQEWLNIELVSYQNNQFILIYRVRGDRNIKRTAVLKPSIPGDYSIKK